MHFVIGPSTRTHPTGRFVVTLKPVHVCVSRLPPVSFYRYFTGLAISHHQTALDRVSGVVCGDACVPGFGCGLARESVGGVGFEVLVSVSCVSRLDPR